MLLNIFWQLWHKKDKMKEVKMNVLKSLLRSRKVWLAIIGVAQTIIFTLLPDFPAEVWQAINVLLLAVIAGIAVEDAAEKAGKNNVKILPAALEGSPDSMQPPPLTSDGDLLKQPPPSVRAWTPPTDD